MPRPSFVFLLVAMVAAKVSWALTESQQAQLVQKHNDYRSEVSPPAADMLKMKWDTAMEDMAIAYAKKCTWAHNPDRGRIGENLFLTTSRTLNVEQAVEDWYKEVQHYDFDNNTCAEDQMCGHYTQVVWASTYKVGCGAQFCEEVEGIDETNASLLVCNYEPPGNILGRKPYTQGNACSMCPAKTSCAGNLCEKTVDLEDTTGEFLTSGDSPPIEWPSIPSTSMYANIDYDAMMSASITDKELLSTQWLSIPGLATVPIVDMSTEELSTPHLTTEEVTSLSLTQSPSPTTFNEAGEHQAFSIMTETDRIRVLDLSTTFTTSSVVEINLAESSLSPVVSEEDTTPRTKDTTEGSSPATSRGPDLSYLIGITEQKQDLEVTTSDFPTETTILPINLASDFDHERTSASADSEVTTSSSRTRKDIMSTRGPSSPDLEGSSDVDAIQEQVTTLHTSIETTPQSLKPSTEAGLDPIKTLAPTTKAAAALQSQSSTTIRTSPRVKISKDQNHQQPIRSDKATSPERTYPLRVPTSDSSNGHHQMYQSDDAESGSQQQPGQNAAPGMQPGSFLLLTVVVFIWFCLN